ncbi:MAG TPA: hypothetical protein PLL78_06565 [Fimbriimonadaceae bacterium]|nr:hypothetical protein [Fimbriimonadaceae bacterium]HRJ96331.1 hypothetical protein [Fimbriimonadaceae bacterium]
MKTTKKNLCTFGLLAALALCLCGCLDDSGLGDSTFSEPEQSGGYPTRMTDEEMSSFIHDEVESAMPPIDYGS